MTVDLTALSSKAQARLIDLGKTYGSRDVLDQARTTGNAYTKLGSKLVGHGFNDADAERLSALERMLSEAVDSRESEVSRKQAASKTLAAAMEAGAAARQAIRGVLMGLQEDFEESGAFEAEEIVTTVLERTSVLPGDSDGLATQLKRLAEAVKHAQVLPAAIKREEAHVADTALAAAAALQQSARAAASSRGTLTETQYMDLLDGLIVRLVRRAARAARNASIQHGDPALAREFRLVKLYPGRSVIPEETEDGSDGAAAEPTRPTTPSSGTPTPKA